MSNKTLSPLDLILELEADENLPTIKEKTIKQLHNEIDIIRQQITMAFDKRDTKALEWLQKSETVRINEIASRFPIIKTNKHGTNYVIL